MAQVSISGAISGIDTAGLINSLVSVQTKQQSLLKQQQTKQQSAADTFGNLISSLSSLSNQAKKIAKTADWKGLVATSSSTGVTATAAGTQTASLTFDVNATAKAHALVSRNSVGSMGAQVASGPLTLTRSDGSTVDVQVGSGSLSEVIAGINGSDAGVVASAVQTSPGQYRLQLSAAETGAASSFTVSGLNGFSGIDVLTQASDAMITIGSNPATAFTVTSAKNTFDDVVPGLSFTVTRPETGVTVSSALDGSAVGDDIKALVDAANAVLNSIDSATEWNATTRSGGPLVGDATARTLQQSILNTVGGTGAPGVSLTRTGQLSFDKDAFVRAFAADPKGVAATFGAGLSFAPAAGVSGSVAYSSSTTSTRAGTYAVQIDGLAATEAWQVDGTLPLATRTIEIARGGVSASYTVGAGDSLDDVATAMNTALSAAGLDISAKVDGSLLRFTAAGSGAAGAFTTTLDGLSQTRTTQGADVSGSIDGRSASGSGTLLSLSSATSGADGLVVDVRMSSGDLSASGGAVGSVTVTSGLAQKLIDLVKAQTATGTGFLTSAKTSREASVKDLQGQIEDWDRRLEAYRTSLQSQFTAMETTLAALKSQTSFLAGFATQTGQQQ